MRRHRPPTLVSMWMLDVFCCALGCVTLLWLLKTREAGQISDEAALAAANLVQTRNELEDTSRQSALRLANAEKLAAEIDALKKQLALVQDERDATAKNLALMRQERDTTAKNLALAEAELAKIKQDLVAARTKIDDLNMTLTGLNSKLTANDVELAKKKAEMEMVNKQLELAKKQVTDLDVLVRDKEKARTDLQMKLTESTKKLDEATRTVTDAGKMQARVEALEKDLKAERTKLDEANVTIVDLQGTKAKLADKVNKLQMETDNKFAGIAMTGKKVLFLVDMSGSMDRLEENTPDATKWPTVRDTLCKVMRSIPDLDQFQVILFSSKPVYLLESTDWLAFEKDKSIDRVHKAMTATKPAGDTNMYLALEEAFKFRAKGMDTIYLISDGLPTSGPGLSTVQQRAGLTDREQTDILARHVRRTLTTVWNKADERNTRVRINAVGFFYESPDVGAFLWALARENDGSFVGMSKP